MRAFALVRDSGIRVTKQQFSVALSFTALVIAGISGYGIAVNGAIFGAAIAAGMAGVLVIFLPVNLLVAGILFVTFLVVGQLQYLLLINKAFWLPYGLGVLIGMRLITDNLGSGSKYDKRPIRINGFLLLMMAYVSAIVFSTAVNASPMLQVLVSVKEYLCLWSLFFVAALGFLTREYLHRMWIALLWLAPLQLPMVLYQRLVVASERRGSSAWDAVVGLFGGNPDGGGASGAMAFFLVFAIVLSISYWRSGIIRLRFMFLVVSSAIASIAMSEVKVALIVLPISIILLYRVELIRRPFKGLVLVSGVLLLSLALTWGYMTQFSSDRTRAGQSIDGYVETMISRATDTSSVNTRDGYMTRTSALVFWSAQHSLDDPLRMLLGHGIGASRVGGTVVGETAARYMYRLDASSATVFLWEIGIIGLTIVLLMFVAAGRMALRVCRNPAASVEERATGTAFAAMLPMYGAEIFYNTDFANIPQSQVIMIMMMGYLMFVSAQLPSTQMGQLDG
ncbi:hypothetical protein [Azoarcus sp. CIB]|uniref:hypothetical protein n=1 Tax=Aromatoleum sp. (strain CIB) TaxID=198107 RepID=UPI000A6C45E2|nr:hypothetical protein [Azoarcus sp. CIB]